MILNLDCREGLAMLPDNSIDAVVTDPPYELGFMGKSWDNSGIAYNVDLWREVLRVLKPGGHMLAFGGSRTYHRMTCAIEDSGFEIRDQIMWIYGSGFPKSLDVSKALDKMHGAEREILATAPADAVGGSGCLRGHSEGAVATTYGDAVSDAAKQWEGWGTALKPAHEPICVARKPLAEKTVAANVLAWGTGGINIDGCRVDSDRPTGWSGGGSALYDGGLSRDGGEARPVEGRWPANLIHDGSPEVLEAFPNTASGEPCGIKAGNNNNVFGQYAGGIAVTGYGDAGSAARFFYCAKASRADRDEGLADFVKITTDDGRAVPADNAYQRGATLRANHHPTVKPTDLMRYLCRLITPAGGQVLDIFAGSGSTAKAAALEGFQFLGFELNPEYAAIANARYEAAKK